MNIFVLFDVLDPHVSTSLRAPCRFNEGSGGPTRRILMSHRVTWSFQSQMQIWVSSVNAEYLSIHCDSWPLTSWRSQGDQWLSFGVLCYPGNEAQHEVFVLQEPLSISASLCQWMFNNSATTASFCFVLGGRHSSGPCTSMAVLRSSEIPRKPEIFKTLCPMTCFTMTHAPTKGFDWFFLCFPH